MTRRREGEIISVIRIGVRKIDGQIDIAVEPNSFLLHRHNASTYATAGKRNAPEARGEFERSLEHNNGMNLFMRSVATVSVKITIAYKLARVSIFVAPL